VKILFAILALALTAPATFARPYGNAVARSVGRAMKRPPAQAAVKKGGDTYRLGTANVVIPSPAGFEEATSQLERVKAVLEATESPLNDLLASHMPSETIARMKRGEAVTPEFYTKVSVLKQMRAANISPADFASLVSAFRSSFGQVLDPEGPQMKSILKNVENGLNGLTDEKTTVGLSQPVNLGEFENQPNAFGMLILMTMKFQTGDRQVEAPLVCAASFVRVKQRVLFVYTYRRYKSAEDREAVRRFTKQWLGQILAANRV
jgi:hypothetical protein